jgi:UDP-N-acetyl-D-mannosaminuronic acid dehydrogenase
MVKGMVVPGQMADFAAFVDAVDLVVIMVGHQHLKDHMAVIQNKWILDTRHVCHFDGVYRL